MNGKKARNIRKAELRDVDVIYISLLWDDMQPSNEENAIIKADGVREFKVEITKIDNIEGIVEGIAMKSDTIDTQGDWYSKDTVRKAGRKYIDFLIEAVGKNAPSDTNHNMIAAPGIKLTDSWIDEDDPEIVKWKIRIDIKENAEAMQKAKDGKITGFSIYGYATKIEKADEGLIKSVAKSIKRELSEFFRPRTIKGDVTDDFNQNMAIDQIYTAWRSFRDNVFTWNDALMEDVWVVSSQEEYLAKVDEFATILKSIYIMKTSEVENMKFEDFTKTDDGKKAIKDFIATEEGKALAVEAGLKLEKVNPENPDGNNGKKEGEDGKPDDEMVKKSELEAKEKEIEDLKNTKTELEGKVESLEKKVRDTTDIIPPPVKPEDVTVDDIIKREKQEALDRAMGTRKNSGQ